MQHRIAMLVSNPCAPDRRVLREAQALAEAGHAVLIIAWDREGAYPPYEELEGIPVRRVRVPAAYGAGLRRLRRWPAYAQHAARHMRDFECDIVHCHDLDTLPIGYVYARRHHTRLVFDAHESYPDFAAPRVPGWATWGLRHLERYLVTRVDALITVGELLAEHYQNWRAPNVTVVRNCPSLEHTPAGLDVAAFREQWGLQDSALVIVYIGGFTSGRVILPILETVRDTPNLGLVLVGSGLQQQQVEALAASVERIVYLGPSIPREQIVPTMHAADVVYYGLRSDHPNNHYSSPNALYSALAAGRPLLTTDIGEIARIVDSEDCGLILDAPTVTAMRAALESLLDRELRERMARRAREAAENRYNWTVARSNLLSLYEKLLEDV